MGKHKARTFFTTHMFVNVIVQLVVVVLFNVDTVLLIGKGTGRQQFIHSLGVTDLPIIHFIFSRTLDPGLE
jgi:hypothetical protein